jgi:hypothetical protein
LLAVANLAAAAGLATFTLDFDFDLEAGLLLIKDFFVIAIVFSPRVKLNFVTPLVVHLVCQITVGESRNFNVIILCNLEKLVKQGSVGNRATEPLKN